MFGGDRFGPEEDFFASYRDAGGVTLDRSTVDRIIRATFESMSVDYADPEKHDNFPQLRDVLEAFGRELPVSEMDLLEHVFTRHEIGKVPREHAAILQKLAAFHRLGLLTNIWSKKTLWQTELEGAGVLSLFHATVFSSDGRHIKPSKILFDLAVSQLGARQQDVLFVGDSLRCDIIGAKAAGLSTVWIDQALQSHPDADFVIAHLEELSLPSFC